MQSVMAAVAAGGSVGYVATRIANDQRVLELKARNPFDLDPGVVERRSAVLATPAVLLTVGGFYRAMSRGRASGLDRAAAYQRAVMDPVVWAGISGTMGASLGSIEGVPVRYSGEPQQIIDLSGDRSPFRKRSD